VRSSGEALEDYLGNTALLLERYGVVLDLGPDDSVALDVSPKGSLSFALRGFLPDDHQPTQRIVEVREIWQPVGGDTYERSEYAYELVDRERDSRRAFHLHDADLFVRRFQVVVHEHCEQPIGHAPCAPVQGGPVRDSFEGVLRLVDAWIDPVDRVCDGLQCLD
jgi:hypothetical protein